MASHQEIYCFSFLMCILLSPIRILGFCSIGVGFWVGGLLQLDIFISVVFLKIHITISSL